MGRGVSYGGGQSSLGYLFGSDEPPKAAAAPGVTAGTNPVSAPAAATVTAGTNPVSAPAAAAAALVKESPPPLSLASPSPSKTSPEGSAVPNVAAGQLGSNPNNYHRADGQNTGNFITDRPSTKVHSAPGGGSSLGYLFGGEN